MATLCAETNAVLKLDLGGTGGIRRIALAKLWDPDTSRVSYQRLSDMALKYSDLTDTKLHCVTVTYTDEDGDSITISTDDELADAFEQFASRVPPIVRAKASFVRKGNTNIVNDLKQAVSEIGETAKSNSPKMDQMQGALESFVMLLTQAADILSKNVEGKKKGCSNENDVPKEVRPNNFRSHKECCSEIKKRRSSTTEDKPTDDTVSPEVEHVNNVEEHSNILPGNADLNQNFIHGRHTCDGCLVTPIIGIRYHALNLPDHDLCEKCALSHSNKNILFEPTELERDRYLQNKWKRRQWRQNRGADARPGRQRRNNPGKLAGSTVDPALKEAIRRSLQDVKTKTEEKDELKEENAVVKESETNTVVEPETLEQNNVETLLEKNDEGEEVGTSTEQNEEAESIAETEDDGEDGLSVVDDETDSCIDDLKLFNTEDDNDGLSFTEEASETTEPDIVEEINEPDSYAQFEAELAVDVTPILPETKEERSTSFADDAEGQGDVAIAIGRALDVTADAIDAVVSEVENDSTFDSQTKTGRTIVESVRSSNSNESDVSIDAESSVDSENEWQLLNEDGQPTSDEMIAQAAQLLGSALFQSDIISEVTEMKDEFTTVTGMSGISTTPSYADSVPTEVRSIMSGAISSVVLSRWDTELKQMHELGFLDDKKNVDALEHLEAAKMGVDSEDAVTVNDAVNYLLSEYRHQV